MYVDLGRCSRADGCGSCDVYVDLGRCSRTDGCGSYAVYVDLVRCSHADLCGASAVYVDLGRCSLRCVCYVYRPWSLFTCRWLWYECCAPCCWYPGLCCPDPA